jgi:hypothetical protein
LRGFHLSLEPSSSEHRKEEDPVSCNHWQLIQQVNLTAVYSTASDYYPAGNEEDCEIGLLFDPVFDLRVVASCKLGWALIRAIGRITICLTIKSSKPIEY